MVILVGDIVDAVNESFCTFKTLRDVAFRRDCSVNAGNSVMVFRVDYRGMDYALRCYRRRHPYLSEIYGDQYFAKEMEVCGEWLDVVLVPWVEGRLLSRFSGDWDVALRAFERLAIEILSREGWAHGDLSADNLVVDAQGVMHYIDCDSNFVEALRGERSVDLGTRVYQSALRRDSDFDETIDDFSVALITVALRALNYDATLAERYPFQDALLLDGARVGALDYELLTEVEQLLASRGDFAGYRLARLLRYQPLRIAYLRDILQQPLGGVSASLLVSFSDGLAWGYRDDGGAVVIPPLFDEAFEFKGDSALVRVASWWYRIDRSGRVVERCEAALRK